MDVSINEQTCMDCIHICLFIVSFHILLIEHIDTMADLSYCDYRGIRRLRSSEPDGTTYRFSADHMHVVVHGFPYRRHWQWVQLRLERSWPDSPHAADTWSQSTIKSQNFSEDNQGLYMHMMMCGKVGIVGIVYGHAHAKYCGRITGNIWEVRYTYQK